MRRFQIRRPLTHILHSWNTERLGLAFAQHDLRDIFRARSAPELLRQCALGHTGPKVDVGLVFPGMSLRVSERWHVSPGSWRLKSGVRSAKPWGLRGRWAGRRVPGRRTARPRDANSGSSRAPNAKPRHERLAKASAHCALSHPRILPKILAICFACRKSSILQNQLELPFQASQA